jgi:hypothetical protein
MQPFRIAKARAFVAQQHPWVPAHYALLCDFVHPNLSSQRAAGISTVSCFFREPLGNNC